ncbi:MAG: hypothetical protein JXA22_05740 [Candidatus Thermoplasmatota archaeon]|nr:hypothetical protein [Candidatus Thermoplasmatota archaeon]
MAFRVMKTWTLLVITLLLSAPLLSATASDAGSSDDDVTPPSRSLVTISKEHLRIVSGGISQWGPLCFGMVNRTTVIEVRLRNTADAPFTGIEVNLTLYWYDAHKGFSFDKGRVMFRDQTLASLGPGDGTLSSVLEFNWVPRYAGAYVMNITIHLPGDPRPYTERTLVAGIQYSLDQKTITDGLWVGTDAWDCSSMDGWTSEEDLGETGMRWHVSNHTLAQGHETLHSPDTAFWVGNDTTGLSPLTGVYSLISPALNLSRFNPDPWDSFLGLSRPQIYLLYKYRGNMTRSCPSGNGGIYHWIRYGTDSGWGDWEPLLDPKGYWVNLTGNTTNVIWDVSKRPFLQGDLELVGLDLGEYQGRTIQLKFEYHPSGIEETGYVIDDVVIIGKETVNIEPFAIGSYTDTVQRSDPGDSVQFDITLLSKVKEGDEPIPVRIEAIDGSGFLDMARDVRVEPGILLLNGDGEDTLPVKLILSIPSSSPSGEGWITVRLFGGGLVLDKTFKFNVNSRRDLDLTVEGMVSGRLEPGERSPLDVSVHNKGNVEEETDLYFLTGSDLITEGELTHIKLGPAQQWEVSLQISVPTLSRAGEKRGFLVLSSSPPTADALEMLLSGQFTDDRTVVELDYFVDQFYQIELIEPSPASTYREIEEPALNGTEDIEYHLILANHGNGVDVVSFSSLDWTERGDIILVLPENFSIDPGFTDFVKIVVRVIYPVPSGIFQFKVMASSDGPGGSTSDIVTLTLSIGRAPVSRGIFLVNGSLELQPSIIVAGREVVISFTVRSFGFLESDTFNANLWIDDKVVLDRQFIISKYQDKFCQLSWKFEEPGDHLLKITLSEGKEPGPGAPDLVLTLTTGLVVGFIDLKVIDMDLVSEGVGTVGTKVQPGNYDCSVTILNGGNTTADLAVMTLVVLDRTSGVKRNLTMNVTEISPGEVMNVSFKNIVLEKERDYQMTVTVENNDRWKDADPEDDLKQIEVEVGSVPPEVPFWRDPYWSLAAFILIMILTMGLLYYLLRRKL